MAGNGEVEGRKSMGELGKEKREMGLVCIDLYHSDCFHVVLIIHEYI